ncbi:MAG TPA: hypothetical protein VGS58_03680, partial [Candidatus Sulfopaludibacter sp.]|nr:hypothetical protein [Candidatus Sulfopaludibacter sp.]
MADPLGSKAVAAPPPTLAVLEETVQLLRQAPFATLVRHWIGSVPFALGLLTFWNGLTTGRMTDEACALDALALSLLLLWMNCWRAVFAGRLRRQLSGTPAVSWTPARVARLAAGQSFLGATRLVMLPLAALVAFPFAAAVDFYRYATALADREDLDPLELISRARALTRVHPGRSWAVLPVLAFLQLVMALNLALAFGFLPFLIRALTGYESEFTRGGTLLLQSPMFAIFVLVATWLAIDPFVQAAYTVRLFHAESVATGEDLRVALRRLRAAQMLAAILLLAIFPARAVSPAELQQSVQKAMQAPEYGWRIPPPAKAIGSRPW